MVTVVLVLVLTLGWLLVAICLTVLTFTAVEIRRVVAENTRAIKRIEATMKEHRC